jgi:hypothetical protein
MADMTKEEYEAAERYYEERLANSGGADHFDWIRCQFKLRIRWAVQHIKMGMWVRVRTGAETGHMYKVEEVKRCGGVEPYVYGKHGEQFRVTNVEPCDPNEVKIPSMWGKRS